MYHKFLIKLEADFEYLRIAVGAAGLVHVLWLRRIVLLTIRLLVERLLATAQLDLLSTTTISGDRSAGLAVHVDGFGEEA